MPRLEDENDAAAAYTSTARFLSNPPSTPPDHQFGNSNTNNNSTTSGSSFSRRYGANNSSSSSSGAAAAAGAAPRWTRLRSSASSIRDRILSLHPVLRSTHDRSLTVLLQLSPLQRTLLGTAGVLVFLSSILILFYHTTILRLLRPFANQIRSSHVLWLVPFCGILLVSFPPLIGYSTLYTLTGFTFGVTRGYALIAPATVLGSTLSFVASRSVLASYTARLLRDESRFEALATVLENDGLPLLVMIRLCPLPYSLSNAAISAVPSVKAWQFAVATAAATPRLLVGLFIGAKLGELADEGEKMPLGARVVSWVSVAVGVGIGVGTGWWMYARVKKRARELEGDAGYGAEEGRGAPAAPRAGGAAGRPRQGLYEDWVDDDDDDEDAIERRTDDGISLHTTAEEERYGHGHGDEDQKTSSPRSLDDVFDAGDGETDEDEETEAVQPSRGRMGGYRDDDDDTARGTSSL